MSGAMRTRTAKIGNSQGIRIPKPLLDQIALDGEVELAIQQDQLVIRPIRRPRAGREEQFKLMAERGDDRLLDATPISSTDWDEAVWMGIDRLRSQAR